ncbi:RNA polymerase sigma factor [Actinomadura parmotrematis]|uniref:Sigma-70 family RNA polymerase sigma factor n=1 Tax=Actinomadura parmotrematis TaxID=2864039 RepID=A0ABS7G5T0_9ACTN|nr:sigma-70 family RNA polymerase sigma factor [Actinomadura parmotrematis]MBW8487735.1 sigma-70 family RNA polymerase sigma factor [Actinomadura parmotrematis]
MNDRVLVESLRARDPQAPAGLYDAYAARLHVFCHFRLRDADAAQVALRDTLIVATTHIDELRVPERLGAWLYTIARGECDRHVPARPRGDGLVWEAVDALAPLYRDLLELRLRHGLADDELEAVLALSEGEAGRLLARAESALASALLAGRDKGGRRVSAARVYEALPEVGPSGEMRALVLSCFDDVELVGYRLFVATRVTCFDAEGFPRASLPPAPRARRPVRLAVAAASAVLLVGGGGAVAYRDGGQETGRGDAVRVTSEARGSQVPSEEGSTPGRAPQAAGTPDVDASPISVTYPLPAARPRPPLRKPGAAPSGKEYQAAPVRRPKAGALQITPPVLDLGDAADGTVRLRAVGGPVSWSVAADGPVEASAASGRVKAGRTVTLGVHVRRTGTGERGEGVLVFQPGGEVRVTWADAPEPGPPRRPGDGAHR